MVSEVFRGFLGFRTQFLNEVSVKNDLGFQIPGFRGFFVFFRGFLGFKTSGNLNYQLLMKLKDLDISDAFGSASAPGS